jgi:hypothetical protein
VDPLILEVYPGAAATFSVYEDDGLSMDYTGARYRRTPVQLSSREGNWKLTIGPPQGDYAGRTPRKQYEVRLHAGRKPGRVTVNGVAQNATWDAGTGVATVMVPADGKGQITVDFAG